MNKILYKHIFTDKMRSNLYGGIIGAGLWLLALILNTTNSGEFLFASIILYLIVLIELYSSSNHYQIVKRANSKKVYNLEQDSSVQYLHHIVLPSLLYISLVLFIFFIEQTNLYFLVIFLGAVLFAILFQNIDAFYDHEFAHNKATYYVYDVINLFLVFLQLFITLNTAGRFGLGISFTIVSALIVLLINILFLVTRHYYSLKLLLGLASMIIIWNIGLFYILNLGLSSWIISFLGSLFFYSIAEYINHSTERKINKAVMIDYMLYIVLAVLVLSVGF